ncbi:peptidoglycan DD-metalloendopeptidase family protein [Parendozoicomonas sp. Alg238-R29]|uniref:murein hydrolase activator EnvC family protein n=1 Tax=Parendozoicomonas sp. Alg238-R29 TaxID=2993446 RepID=UPI00248E12B6|nr:peptidoglycan DD-metalloendopeptidase family protein [Parendozoicomonas sp. Alg238-R29]
MKITPTAHRRAALARIAITALIMLMPFSMPTPAEGNDQKVSNSARLETVNQDIKTLRTLLEKIKKERSSIESRLENTEQEISRVQKELKNTERDLREAKDAAKKQKAQRQTLKKEQSSRQLEVSKALKAAYVAGKNPQMKLLLNQEDPAKAHRMMVYYDHFAQAQSNSLTALKETDRKLAHAETNLLKANKSISRHQQTLASRAQNLKANQSNRQQTLAKLSTNEKQNNSRLSRLRKEQKILQELLASIISMADVTAVDRPFNKSRGKMPWPVKGQLLYKFGERRQDTKLTWNGVYIKASEGAIVNAPHHGRVVFADWMKSFGQLLILDHGNGYMTLYAHNQDMMKTVGDWVLPGEAIARVGNSGGQPHSGLYFEVRYKGKPSNPMTWLVASR